MRVTLLAGFGLGLSLIIAIGAQNVFVLRQGLARSYVGLVVVICAVSDAVLIAAGVAGLGALVESTPWLVTAARVGGAAFLLVYGALAAHRAWRPRGESLDTASGTAPRARKAAWGVAVTALALTWLNPHVYLDTVFLLGSIAATHGDERWLFAAGAIAGSIVWFAGLGYGARFLSRWLSKPAAWRWLDGGIAVVMMVLAIQLLRGA